MELSLTEDQRSLRELARQILGDVVTPERLKQVEAGTEAHDAGLWSELGRAGLLGVGIPESDGGSGGGMVELCLLLEEQGRTVAPAPLFPSLVLGGMPIAAFGSEEQRERHLLAVAQGTSVLTAALPPDGGKPSVVASGNVLTGTVDGVRAATAAAALLVPAAHTVEVRMFLVDPSAVTIASQVVTNKERRGRVTLDGTDGEPLGGAEVYGWLFPRAVVGLCALQVGVCERALRLTAEYVTERVQFERPLGTFQAVQQRLADAYIDVEAMRWTMWQAAWRLDEGLPAHDEVAIAKFWAADGGQRVVAAAQHLHGGIGVDVDYPLHRYTLWAKDLELSLGGASRHLAGLGELIMERA